MPFKVARGEVCVEMGDGVGDTDLYPAELGDGVGDGLNIRANVD